MEQISLLPLCFNTKLNVILPSILVDCYAFNHFSVFEKFDIPVSLSCVSDACFDLPAFANHKTSIRIISDICNAYPSDSKTAALYKKNDNLYM